MHGGLSPEIKSLEQIKRIARPTDVPDSGLLCDLLWADPDKDIQVRGFEGEVASCLQPGMFAQLSTVDWSQQAALEIFRGWG